MAVQHTTNFGMNRASEKAGHCEEGMTVRTARLDRLLTDSWLSIGPTVMKVDVEGFEYSALVSYGSLWSEAHYRPSYILLELNQDLLTRLKRHGSNLRNVLLFLEDKGYTTYHGDLSLVDMAQVHAGDDTFNLGGFCVYNYVAVRRGVELPPGIELDCNG